MKKTIVGKLFLMLGILDNRLGINFKKSRDNICHGVTKDSPSDGIFGTLSKLITLLIYSCLLKLV